MRNENNDNARFEQDEEHIQSLVTRYEDMLRKNTRLYFDIDEFELIIDHYLWTANIADALQVVTIADSFYPDSGDLKIKRADILIMKGEPHSALKILDLLERIEPNNATVNFTKAKANIDIDNSREASRQFELALNKEPETAFDMLGQITDYLIDSGEYAFALKYLKRTCEQQPSNTDILYQAAFCYDRIDEWENAIAFYNKYLDENPFDESVWFNLGSLYERKNMHNEAIEAFDFALTVNDSYPPALYNKANALVNMERYDDAITAFNAFLQVEPNNFYAQCTIGECYEKMGKCNEAVECYTKIIETDPSFPDSYYGLSIVMLRLGRYNDSALYITKALEIDKENPDFWYASGELLLKMQQPHDALTAFHKTIEINPYDIDAWIYIAELKADESLIDAVLILKKAYFHSPDSARLAFRLAALFHLLADEECCIFFFEKGLLHDAMLADEFFKICPDAVTNNDLMQLYNKKTNKTR